MPRAASVLHSVQTAALEESWMPGVVQIFQTSILPRERRDVRICAHCNLSGLVLEEAPAADFGRDPEAG
jgi:hypothetical protein